MWRATATGSSSLGWPGAGAVVERGHCISWPAGRGAGAVVERGRWPRPGTVQPCVVPARRCIAMVLIWNQLAGGNPEFCALLVALNSICQMILFAPLALFYLKVVSRQYGEGSAVSGREGSGSRGQGSGVSGSGPGLPPLFSPHILFRSVRWTKVDPPCCLSPEVSYGHARGHF